MNQKVVDTAEERTWSIQFSPHRLYLVEEDSVRGEVLLTRFKAKALRMTLAEAARLKDKLMQFCAVLTVVRNPLPLALVAD